MLLGHSDESSKNNYIIDSLFNQFYKKLIRSMENITNEYRFSNEIIMYNKCNVFSNVSVNL